MLTVPWFVGGWIIRSVLVNSIVRRGSAKILGIAQGNCVTDCISSWHVPAWLKNAWMVPEGLMELLDRN
jgi:hypothetical protein